MRAVLLWPESMMMRDTILSRSLVSFLIKLFSCANALFYHKMLLCRQRYHQFIQSFRLHSDCLIQTRVETDNEMMNLKPLGLLTH